jgi:putative heme-binding domain-containing protein
LELLAKIITDDHPRVRIEAMRALARIPTARSAELALSVLDSPRSGGRQSAADQTDGRRLPSAAMELDPFLEYALWLTINDLAEPWATAVESGAWKIEGREKQLQYALKAIEPKLATRLMAKVIGDKPIPRDGSGGMIELIGQAGGPRELRQLFDAFQKGLDESAAVRALTALSEAARLRNARPTGDLDGVGRHPYSQTSVHAASLRLMGVWKIGKYTDELLQIAGNKSQPEELRSASIDALRDLGGRTATVGLRELASDKNDFATRRRAAAALAATDLNGSMARILEVVGATTKEEDALALWRSLLSVKGASPALASAVSKTTLPESTARAGLRAAREGGRSEPNLVLALNRAGGLSDPSAALTEGEIHAIAYEVTKGKPENGEKVYRQKQLGCVLCHSIGGAGGKVGPDMTSLGASTPVADYIVESVLLPNKRVKEGFNSIQITTREGEDIAGNLVREDNEQVILRDATAREVSVPKRTIASRKMGGSLMPAGLLDFITPQERLDLYAFLSRLGKPGEYDATKQNVARVWRLNSKVGTVNADEMLKSDLRGKDWTPVYATVGGTLPKSDVMAELDGKDATVWLASRFQTAKSGATKFTISGTASPKAWIDGKPIGGDSDLTVDLPAGQHTFFIKVTTTDIAQGLKLESSDATFLVE